MSLSDGAPAMPHGFMVTVLASFRINVGAASIEAAADVATGITRPIFEKHFPRAQGLVLTVPVIVVAGASDLAPRDA